MAMVWDYFAYLVSDDCDEGVEQAPPAGLRDDSSKFVRWSSAAAERFVRWVVAARGEFPEAPAAATFSRNYQLIRRSTSIHSPIPCGGGVYLYSMWGTYYYGGAAPPGVDTDIPVGGFPQSFDNVGPNMTTFPKTKFKRFLLTGQMVG